MSRKGSWFIGAWFMLAVASLVAQPPQPTFRATTDLIVVETQVVNSDGRPIPELRPSDFKVKVGGRERKVVSATFVQYTDGTEGLTARRVENTGGPLPAGVPPPADGRIFVIAVDEYSFRDNQLLPQLQETHAFLDRLQPEDQVALYGFPTGRTLINLTRDREVIRKALSPALGGYGVPKSAYNLSASEIIDLTAGDRGVLNAVVERECSSLDRTCPAAVLAEARILTGEHEGRASTSLRGLRDLFKSLAPIPGRKTVVLLTGGMLEGDRVGGRPSIASRATQAGRDAALANATLYVIHRDDHFLEAMSVSKGRGARAPNIRDTAQMAAGLEFLAGAANGHLINVSAGTSEFAFSRVLRETAAYYILGVQPEPRDRDGKVHYIEVSVPEHKSRVRHRTTMTIPKR